MLVTVQERFMVWQLDRPAADNGVDETTMSAMEAGLAQLEAQTDELSCLVVRGDNKVFCTGLDASMLEVCFNDRAKFSSVVHRMSEILERMSALSQISIACVDGNCRLGGVELALACDLVLASEGAQFTDGHLAYDAMPGGGATKRLPSRLGYGRALLFLLESPVLSAGEAFKAGLVDEVVAAGSACERGTDLARSISKRNIALVQDLKTSVRAAMPAPPDKSFLRAFERSVIDRLAGD
ncbi:enoyl-CoA hydratase/isomerase family protein [Roseibium sp. SCPC15]|uniref:enoyl-CoA hydratase/isomerase family protein n=1 Tax=Roseibium sp. SCP15 TaxID=3141376 RepID=UPI003338F9C9